MSSDSDGLSHELITRFVTILEAPTAAILSDTFNDAYLSGAIIINKYRNEAMELDETKEVNRHVLGRGGIFASKPPSNLNWTSH